MQILKDMHKYNIDEIFLTYIDKELEKLKSQLPLIDLLVQAFSNLKKQLVNFRQLNSELQALQIRLVVDAMVKLYCGLMLCIEALAQRSQASSKMDCFHYYASLHLERREIHYNADYLQLANHIVNE